MSILGWLNKALSTDPNDASTQFKSGVRYYTGRGVAQDYQQAVYWFHKAAEQGHTEAQYNLGICYENGKGVVQNYQQAAYWFQKAAAQGYAAAQHNIGCYYAAGKGVVQNYQQAIYWIQKAANQGFAMAQYSLGGLYYKGLGVAQDYQQAIYWLRKAAEQGHADAQNRLRSLLSKAPTEPLESTVLNDSEELYNLGYSYYHGEGVPQNYQLAVKWYRKAAEQGHAESQCNLGRCYYYGHGVAQDYQQAAYWLHKAAEQGHTEAQYNLGVCYENGDGVIQDYQQAAQWYRRAAEQGDADAQEALRSLPPMPSTPSQSQPNPSTPTPPPKAPSKPKLSIEEELLNYLKTQPICWEFPLTTQDKALNKFCEALVFSDSVAAASSNDTIKELELTIQKKRARNPRLADHNAAMEGNILAMLYEYSYLMHIFHALDDMKFDTTKVDIQKLWLLIQKDCNARINNLAEEKRKNPTIQIVLDKYNYDHQITQLKVLKDATGREMDYIISFIMAYSLLTVISLLFSNPQLLQPLKPYSADDIAGMMNALVNASAGLRFTAYSR